MDAAPLDRTRTFSPAEVLRMVEVGILSPDEPVELIRGRLVVVSPQGPEHASAAGTLREKLVAAYGSGFAVREEKPIQLEDGLPEPDLAVVRGVHGDYARRHPGPADTVLVVEVAVTSQAIDREKAQDYARAGIPVCWLIDVPARRLEVHSDPQPDGRYRVVQVLGERDEVSPSGTTAKLTVADVLR